MHVWALRLSRETPRYFENGHRVCVRERLRGMEGEEWGKEGGEGGGEEGGERERGREGRKGRGGREAGGGEGAGVKRQERSDLSAVTGRCARCVEVGGSTCFNRLLLCAILVPEAV